MINLMLVYICDPTDTQYRIFSEKEQKTRALHVQLNMIQILK